MIIFDEVNIKFEKLPPNIRRELSNEMKYLIPYARYTPQYKLGRWDGMKRYFDVAGRGYLNHLEKLLPILTKNGYEITHIDDRRIPFDMGDISPIDENFWAHVNWPDGHDKAGTPILLRDYQVDAVNTFLANPQSMQQISTGSGKTILTATLSKLVEPLGRSLVIVPSKNLVTQTESDYKMLGLDVGVFFGDRKELGKTHTICTWQSLNSLNKSNKVNDEMVTLTEFLEGVVSVIGDECHTVKADVLTKLFTSQLRNTPIRWGLSGTIPKEDYEYQGILASIGPVVNNIEAHELQEKGVLSYLEIKVQQLIDIREFNSYHEEHNYLVTNTNRLEYLAKKFTDIGSTGNTLILVTRIETGKKLQQLIPNSTFIRGEVRLKQREKKYKEINDLDNQILIGTYGVVSTGINIPRIFNLILFEPGKSFIRVIQSIGRGIRKVQDKNFLNVYDVASTCKYSKRHLGKRKTHYRESKYPYVIEKLDWDI